MKKFILPIAFTVMASCISHPDADDSETVKQVLTGYFEGISNKDFQKMKNLTTADFVLYEDGMVYNNDSLIKLIKSIPKYTVQYTFRDFNIVSGQTNAHMYYRNHGEFVFNDTAKVAYDWLESAGFILVDGTWKMNFLHSTVQKTQ